MDRGRDGQPGAAPVSAVGPRRPWVSSPSRARSADQALVNVESYVRAGLHDQSIFGRVYGETLDTDQLEAWEINRDDLPHLVEAACTARHCPTCSAAQTPALVLWGDDDRIVPRECGERYARALPNARLHVIPDCGHLDRAGPYGKNWPGSSAFLAGDGGCSHRLGRIAPVPNPPPPLLSPTRRPKGAPRASDVLHRTVDSRGLSGRGGGP
ncbi:MAG: alpha/beta fold hydrolase [Dehalococcoidia bacterium]